MPNGKPYANTNFGGPGTVIPPPHPSEPSARPWAPATTFAPARTSRLATEPLEPSLEPAPASLIPIKYLGGRAPEFLFYNFGIQREVTNDITVSVNYVGSQSHFIAGAGNIRGLQSGEVDPKWLALGSNLANAATQTNINNAQTATGLSLPIPYAGYTAAAALSTNASIQHMLTWMPQYGGSTDTWGDVANANYNAFQLSIAHRQSHGLTLNLNYTYSKNIDDAGTQRTGYAIPAAFIASGKAWAQNRIDRSLSINSQPQNLSIFGVYELPFGKGGIGADNRLVRALVGGWQFSSIFQYYAGVPLAVTGSSNSTQNPGQGTYMPDVNPNFHGSPRINGGWGKGVTAATLGSVSYIQGYIQNTTSGNGTNGSAAVACSASSGPFCNTGNYMIGDAPRVAPYGLRGPGVYRLTSALIRNLRHNRTLQVHLPRRLPECHQHRHLRQQRGEQPDRRQCKLQHVRHRRLR